MTTMKSLCLASALVGLCGTGVFAADSLTLLNPPNSGYVAGGVYTSPYNINVNNGVTNVPMQLVCDDFTTDIYLGETWPASATTLTDLTATSVEDLKFGNPADEPSGASLVYANTAEDYAVAAVLTAELMLLPSSDTEAAAAYSFAIWDVFDSGLLTSTPGQPYGNDPYGSLSPSASPGVFSDANADLAAAEALVTAVMPTTGPNAGSVNLSQISINGNSIQSLTVYTPVVPPGPNAQEFLQVSMPEPSYPAVLALDLLAVVGLIAFFRRRKASSVG